MSTDLAGKRLEMLNRAFLKGMRFGILYNPGEPATELEMRETEAAASAIGVTLPANTATGCGASFASLSPPSIRQQKSCGPGAWGYDLHDALVCREGEPVILGRHISAFAGSGLDAALKTRGITDLVLTGVATNFVVINTACSAIDRGYSCLVLEDCCTSGSEQMHRDAIDHLRPIAEIWQSQSFFEAITR